MESRLSRNGRLIRKQWSLNVLSNVYATFKSHHPPLIRNWEIYESATSAWKAKLLEEQVVIMLQEEVFLVQKENEK